MAAATIVNGVYVYQGWRLARRQLMEMYRAPERTASVGLLVGAPGAGKTLFLRRFGHGLKAQGATVRTGPRAAPGRAGEADVDVVLLDDADQLDDAALRRQASTGDGFFIFAGAEPLTDRLHALGIEAQTVRLGPMRLAEIRTFVPLLLSRAGREGVDVSDDDVIRLARRSAGAPGALITLVDALGMQRDEARMPLQAHIPSTPAAPAMQVTETRTPVADAAAASGTQGIRGAGVVAAAPRGATVGFASMPAAAASRLTPPDEALAPFLAAQPLHEADLLPLAACEPSLIPAGSIPLGSMPLGSMPLGSMPSGSMPAGPVQAGRLSRRAGGLAIVAVGLALAACLLLLWPSRPGVMRQQARTAASDSAAKPKLRHLEGPIARPTIDRAAPAEAPDIVTMMATAEIASHAGARVLSSAGPVIVPAPESAPAPVPPVAAQGMPLPEGAPLHVALLFDRGDAAGERRASALAQALAGRDIAVAPPLASMAASRAGIHYFYAEDRSGALALERTVGDAYGPATLVAHAHPGRPPGTLEVVVGAEPTDPSVRAR